MHATLLAVVAKYCRRQLATRVAVDTGCVNEEISGNVFRQSLLNVSHTTNHYLRKTMLKCNRLPRTRIWDRGRPARNVRIRVDSINQHCSRSELTAGETPQAPVARFSALAYGTVAD